MLQPLAKWTYRCHSKSPLVASLYECRHCSRPRMPYQHSSRHHQSQQQPHAFHLEHAHQVPYQERQKYWLKNALCQKYRIHSLRGAENLRYHRNDAGYPFCRGALSRFCADNFDDPHPKSNGRTAFEIHSARQPSIQQFPSLKTSDHQF